MSKNPYFEVGDTVRVGSDCMTFGWEGIINSFNAAKTQVLVELIKPSFKYKPVLHINYANEKKWYSVKSLKNLEPEASYNSHLAKNGEPEMKTAVFTKYSCCYLSDTVLEIDEDAIVVFGDGLNHCIDQFNESGPDNIEEYEYVYYEGREYDLTQKTTVELSE